MSHSRRAENSKVRAWDGPVAAKNALDENRVWVVWGRGPRTVDGLRHATPGDDLAEGIVRGRDPSWGTDDDPMAWVITLKADEDDVDAWVLEDESAIGYAASLITPGDELPPAEVEATVRRGRVPEQPRRPAEHPKRPAEQAKRPAEQARPGPGRPQSTGRATPMAQQPKQASDRSDAARAPRAGRPPSRRPEPAREPAVQPQESGPLAIPFGIARMVATPVWAAARLATGIATGAVRTLRRVLSNG